MANANRCEGNKRMKRERRVGAMLIGLIFMILQSVLLYIVIMGSGEGIMNEIIGMMK